MALDVLSSPALPMSSSILLPSPSHTALSPSPSPSPTSIPLPALQTDLSSSSSSSTSGSCLDLHRTLSAPSSRRIRFAPLPDPRRDTFDALGPSSDDPQSDPKPSSQAAPAPAPSPADLPDGFVVLSPSVSPDSTLSSARSTPTIRTSPTTPSRNSPKSNLNLLRPFSFLRRAGSSSPNRSPPSKSASLPGSHNPSLSSLTPSSSSVPSSPSSFKPAKLHRISTEDIPSFSAKSLFRARSGSASITRLPRTSSPPPKPSHPTKFLPRSASTDSGPGSKPGNAELDRGESSSHSRDMSSIAGSGTKKRRASSSALTPGAGGGRHAASIKMLPADSLVRPSTAPSSPLVPQKRYVKMLNGRVYGAKRHAAQMLANPFANVRDEPEFVEWGYGGMGSVQASAGIASDIWKGLQSSERGGVLLAGSSLSSSPASTHSAAVVAGGGRGSGARATPAIARRKMLDNVPECGMGNVVAGAELGEDDGSGMGWVKRRRAEREAKARFEQEAKELEKNTQEGLTSVDSTDASMYASTASTTTSLTACTSAASTDVTTPTTSPLPSRSPSVTDLNLSTTPFSDFRSSHVAPPHIVAQSLKSDAPHPPLVSKDEQEHHVLTAIRLSPTNISSKHSHSQVAKGTDGEGAEQVPPLSPADTDETTPSMNSFDEEEPSRGPNEEDDVDDDEDEEAQDISRKTALGAGVEKISRHVDA